MCQASHQKNYFIFVNLTPHWPQPSHSDKPNAGACTHHSRWYRSHQRLTRSAAQLPKPLHRPLLSLFSPPHPWSLALFTRALLCGRGSITCVTPKQPQDSCPKWDGFIWDARVQWAGFYAWLPSAGLYHLHLWIPDCRRSRQLFKSLQSELAGEAKGGRGLQLTRLSLSRIAVPWSHFDRIPVEVCCVVVSPEFNSLVSQLYSLFA